MGGRERGTLGRARWRVTLGCLTFWPGVGMFMWITIDLLSRALVSGMKRNQIKTLQNVTHITLTYAPSEGGQAYVCCILRVL